MSTTKRRGIRPPQLADGLAPNAGGSRPEPGYTKGAA
jgi:hypothetical protein